jgi:DNA-binding transcriptional LysR family regulator
MGCLDSPGDVMNFHQLRLFCTVVERGSFALASQELFLSQPALSVQVKRLERSLGVELLRRSRTGVAPTVAGQELYNVAHHLLEQLRATEQRLHDIKTGEAGSLSIGVSHTGALYLLTTIVKEFGRAYPEARVRIVVTPAPRIFEEIVRGDLHAGLEWDFAVPPALRTIVLIRDQFRVVAAVSHPRATDGWISRDDFLRCPYFTLHTGIGVPSFVEIWLVEHNLVPSTITYLPSIDAVKRMVEAGLGLTILSHFSSEREREAGYLTALQMNELCMQRSIVLLMQQGAISPVLSIFVQFARDFAETYARSHAPHLLPDLLA